MRFTHIGELPRHLYMYVDRRLTHREGAGFAPAVWFGVTAIPGRMWGCTVLLESGAVYRSLPPHALAWRPDPDGDWTPAQAQRWDCYGEAFTALEYRYLAGLRVRVRVGEAEALGHYLLTLAPFGDGFSAAPEQAKEFKVIALDSGWLTIQPTDQVVFEEASFTGPVTGFPHGLRRSTTVYTCE